MTLTSDQELALKEIAEQVIGQTRPTELVLVKHLDFKQLSNDSDSILGFDPGAMAQIVLPHLLALLQTLATTTAKDCAERWGKNLADWIFHKEERRTLDADSLRKVGEAFRGRLIREGRSEEESLRISDALVSTLVSHPTLLRKLVKA